MKRRGFFGSLLSVGAALWFSADRVLGAARQGKPLPHHWPPEPAAPLFSVAYSFWHGGNYYGDYQLVEESNIDSAADFMANRAAHAMCQLGADVEVYCIIKGTDGAVVNAAKSRVDLTFSKKVRFFHKWEVQNGIRRQKAEGRAEAPGAEA